MISFETFLYGCLVSQAAFIYTYFLRSMSTGIKLGNFLTKKSKLSLLFSTCNHAVHHLIKSGKLQSDLIKPQSPLRPSFFYFLFYRFFSQQVSVGGRNKNKNKIHSDHFPIELKLKETQETVFPSILIQLENGPNEFYFTN